MKSFIVLLFAVFEFSGYLPSAQAAANLTGTATRVTTTGVVIDLTALGGADWMFYGPPSTCSGGPCFTKEKANGRGLTGAYATIPDGNFYPDNPNPVIDPNVRTSWSDADTTSGGAAAGNTITASNLLTSSVYMQAIADPNQRTLTLVAGGAYGGGGTLQFTAHLSDDSAPDYVYIVNVPAFVRTPVIFTLAYAAASAGSNLRVTIARVVGPAPIFFQAAALTGNAAQAIASVIAPVSGPQVSGNSTQVTTEGVPINLTTLGTADWKFYGPPSTCSGGPCASRQKASGSGLTGAYAAATPDANFYGGYPNPSIDPNVNTLWTDGDTSTGFPSAGSSINSAWLNTTTVYFDAIADTSLRTLTVVGGEDYGSGGTFKVTAHISDNSAADYVNTITVPPYVRVPLIVTLTYAAAGPGASLRVTFTSLSGSHGMMLQAAALSGMPAVVAAAPAPITPAAAQALTMTTAVITSKGQPVDLTALGPTDWQYFGPPMSCGWGPCFSQRKAGGFGIVGAYATHNPDWNFYTDAPNPVADPNINSVWRDADTSSGSPAAGGSLNSGGIYSSSAYVIAMADQTVRTLTLLTGGGYGSGGAILIAGHLSDGSSPDVSTTINIPAYTRTPVIVTLNYKAAVSGANLRVTITRLSGNQDTMLQAAALSAPSASAGPFTATLSLADDIQGFLNGARPGDTLILPVGYTWTGNLLLTPKPLMLDSSNNPLLVTVKSTLNLADGLRVRPGEPTATIISPSSNPCILNDIGNPNHALRAASYYKFDGLNLKSTSTLNYSLVLLSYGDNPALQDAAHHVEFHHMYLHAPDAVLDANGNIVSDFEALRGFYLDANNIIVADSYVDNFRSRSGEANAIYTSVGQNLTYLNNFLEGAGETVMVSGGSSPIRTTIAANITVRHNYLTHRMSWRYGPYIVKNNLETKGVIGYTVDTNLIENTWASAQNGTAILVSQRTGYGTIPQSRVENASFTNNIIRHAGACFNMGVYDDQSGLPISQLVPSNHITLQNNICDDISRHKWGGNGIGIQFAGGVPNYTTLQNNTVNFAETIGQVGSVMSDGSILNLTDNSSVYFAVPYLGPGVAPYLTTIVGFTAAQNDFNWQIFGDSYSGPNAVAAYITNFPGNTFIGNSVTNLRLVDAATWIGNPLGQLNFINPAGLGTTGANTSTLLANESAVRNGNR